MPATLAGVRTNLLQDWQWNSMGFPAAAVLGDWAESRKVGFFLVFARLPVFKAPARVDPGWGM